jgi:hypothetical protein
MPLQHVENLVAHHVCYHQGASKPGLLFAQRSSQTYVLCPRECEHVQDAIEHTREAIVAVSAVSSGVVGSSMQRFDTPVLHLTYGILFAGGYYHALVQLLPSVVPFLPQLRAGKMRLFLEEEVALLLAPVLKRLGLNDQALLKSGADVVCAPEWHLQRYQDLTATQHPSPARLAALRRKLQLPDGPRPLGAVRRSVAILSRGNSSRSISNEEELVQGLRSLGRPIEVIHADSRNLPEVIEAMSRAEVLVGVHGANLANMIFAPERAKVLEIVPQVPFRPVNYHYWALAGALDFSYKPIGQQVQDWGYDGELAKDPMTQSKAVRSFSVDTKSIVDEVAALLPEFLEG